MSNLPHLTVACVIKRDDRYLLVEEIKHNKTVLNQPAGHVDAGESLIDAAIRETLEETGWTVKIQSLLGLYRYYAQANQTHYVRVTFVAEAVEQITDQLDPDIVQAIWLSKEDIIKRQSQLRSPLVLENIIDYESGQQFSVEVFK